MRSNAMTADWSGLPVDTLDVGGMAGAERVKGMTFLEAQRELGLEGDDVKPTRRRA